MISSIDSVTVEALYHMPYDTEGKTIPVYEPGNYMVTTCVIKDKEGKKLVGGISICSPKDQYNRKKGNMIARGRAYKALERKQDSCPVIGKTGKILGIKYLSAYLSPDKV